MTRCDADLDEIDDLHPARDVDVTRRDAGKTLFDVDVEKYDVEVHGKNPGVHGDYVEVAKPDVVLSEVHGDVRAYDVELP